jgi:hypothetical protein
VNTHGETDLNLFSTKPRYDTAVSATVRHALWFRGLNCSARNNRITRSQTSAIRFSDGASGEAVGNRIVQARLNGINPSTGSTDVLVASNRIIDTHYIGIAAFSGDSSESNRHLIIGNHVINTTGYGETGIEHAGTTTHVRGAIIANNVVKGFGLTGLRCLYSDDGIFLGNNVSDIGLSAAQQARWTGSTQRSGLVINDSLRWVVDGNRIDNTDNFGIFSETESVVISPSNYITNTVGDEIKITGESGWNGYAAWDMAPGAALVRGARTFKDKVTLKAGMASILPTYADNAAAVSGGLAVNDEYKTSTGERRIVV